MATTLLPNVPVVILSSLPTGDVKSPGYSLPPVVGGATGHTIAWIASYDSAPSAISLQIQGSFDDVDADYVVLDTSTNTAGEAKTILNVAYPWIRARQVSKTGAVTTTIRLVIQ